MRFKNKILLSIFLFFMIIILNNCVLGAEKIYLGESKLLYPENFPNITTDIGTSTPFAFAKGPFGGDNITIGDKTIITAEKNSDQWGKGYASIEVVGLKAGKTTLSVQLYYPAGTAGSEQRGQTIEIEVVDRATEEAQKAQEKVQEMENAYKTVPSENATAEEISIFMKSYANKAESLSEEEKNKMWEELAQKVSIDTAKKWQQKLRDAMANDAVLRQAYMPADAKLGNYITNGYFSTDGKALANQHQDSVNATKLHIISLTKNINGSRDFTEFKDLLDDIGVYEPTDLDADTANKIEGIASKILTVITDIGMVISVIMLGFIGIKYMIGSVEEKAEYKKDMIPYLIGAMLLFGITAFVKVLMAFGNQISSNI